MARKESIREKLEQLKEKGEETLSHLSEEIRTSPGFVKAVQGARRGQEMVEASLRKAANRLDSPSRDEFQALLVRVDVLERKVARLTRPSTVSSSKSRTAASGRERSAPSGSKKGAAGVPRRRG